ncbi:gamma-glutamyl hydrolase-like [Porites lutea]|uniref:gamma-glutamyl hydrolase-like n=1 Tax=Porites lutea TaxID=51062 RepID=UPI003CC61813
MSFAKCMVIFKQPFSYEEKTDRPIIGVLTQETDGHVTKFGTQYVAASYVKFIESAGGRMVPILVNSTSEQIEKMFNSINGVIFPGGHRLTNTNYTRVGKQIFDLALKAFDNGDVFPIWAECLGFELVSMLAAKRDLSSGIVDRKFFTKVDAQNISLPLHIPKDYKNTALWEHAPSNIVDYLGRNSVTYHNHRFAITPQTYRKTKHLQDFFKVVSTSKDRKGVEFISNMEGKRYPIYLFHWHPSKAQYELRTDLDIKHSFRLILAAQYLADFFIRQARRSSHQFSSEKEERAALIYNYKMAYVEKLLPVSQAYFF